MKAVTFKLNTVLAAVAGALCLLAVLLRTFAPITVQLPNIDIPCLAAVSLIAIVVVSKLTAEPSKEVLDEFDHYMEADV